MRLDRLLSIVIKLLSHKRLTTKQLALEFGVSIRTIFRDLQTISLSNIPIVSIQGKQGGWEIMPDYLLDRRVLSLDDIANILSALSSVERGISHPSVKQTLDKMSSLIPQSKNKDIAQKMNHVVIDSQPWGMGKSLQNKLTDIQTAIYDSVLITFTYHNLKKEQLARIVEPMTLLLKGANWYLFGYCQNKKDFRLFRLSRIQKLKISDQSFSRREKSINDYREKAKNPDKSVKLTLQFHKEASTFISDMFGLEHAEYTGEYGMLQVQLPENEWLYGLLLSFGSSIQICKPKRIADLIKNRAQNIVKLYS
ncbi:MAG: YafY family transcriptional regulator [bacterium]|nr:YafY family transcriptional regulator [bacterium]